MRSSICSFPVVPSAIAVNSTDTHIYARIVQPNILRDWVSDFCFLYEKNGTAATPTVVCDKNESTVLSGLATNTLYRIRAFFKTTIGHNSSMSSEFKIGTLPKGKGCGYIIIIPTPTGSEVKSFA